MWTENTTDLSAHLRAEGDLAHAESSEDLLSRLERLHPQSIDLSLTRIRRLLRALGHPERRLPPVVHVAGTNGKGSVIAFLKAIAEAAGRRVHSYTSPHLVDFRERIVLGGDNGSAPISDHDLAHYLRVAEKANAGAPITLFEITTAAAMLAFAKTPADILLLETGLGGRLDATNVVAAPALTIITPVSIDHVSYLGDTVEQIAKEKAGILKPGVKCIVGRQEPGALGVITTRAKQLVAPLMVRGHDYDVSQSDERLLFHSLGRLVNLPLPVLKGRHQIDNAGTAIAAADVLFGRDVSIEALEKGLQNASWPARLQRLEGGPLNDRVKPETEVWLDGGHNPSGAVAVADWVAEQTSRRGREVHLVWGMMDTKDAGAVIAPFRGLVHHTYTVPIPEEANSYGPEHLAAIASAAGLRATPTTGIFHALALANCATKSAIILICGSLYLAGHVLKIQNEM